jgi:hypothetical protein
MKASFPLSREKFTPFATLSTSQLRALAKSGVILVAIVVTIWFTALTHTKRERAADAQQRAAWAARPASPATQSLDSFVATWSASQAAVGESETIRWRATDAHDVAASLLAFDSVNLNARTVVRLEIKRQDGRFNVIAELTK